MLKVLSRNPHKYFAFNDKSTTSVTVRDDGLLYKYTCVHLRVDLNEIFVSGVYIHSVIVCWKTFEMKIYNDEEDETHNVLSFEGKVESCVSMNDMLLHIINFECFLFLNRGHSRFHKDCQCMDHNQLRKCFEKMELPNYENRLNDLGLIPKTGICKLERQKVMRSIKEIEMELGIFGFESSDVIDVHLPSHIVKRMDVLRGMETLGGFQMIKNGKEHYIHHDICCVPVNIDDANDILKAIMIYKPKPFRWDFPMMDTVQPDRLHSLYLYNQQIVEQVKNEYKHEIIVIDHQRNADSKHIVSFTFFHNEYTSEPIDTLLKELYKSKGEWKCGTKFKTISFKNFNPIKKLKVKK